jgi:hypothetical protein
MLSRDKSFVPTGLRRGARRRPARMAQGRAASLAANAIARTLLAVRTFGTQEETAAFLKRCRRRHKALRKEAQKQGERLFAERARPFAERIETYWQIAAGDAALARVEKRPDNVVAFGDPRIPRAS